MLLVEDEEIVRQMAGEALRSEGYMVIEAENGRRALEMFREHAPQIDLMVTDVVMPEMSGTQLAHAASLLRPDIQVLYMSGYTDESIVPHDVLDADVAFIHKPLTPAALLAKVREVLNSKTDEGVEDK